MIPVTELQARVFFELLSGNIRLPPKDMMLGDIRQKRDAIAKRFVHSVRHTIQVRNELIDQFYAGKSQVEFIAYLDELAEMIGCKPDPLAFAFTDPKLAYHVLFGPNVPALYRLQGPHPWQDARETILSVDERVRKPFDTRKPAEPPANHWLCEMESLRWKMSLVVLGITLFYALFV